MTVVHIPDRSDEEDRRHEDQVQRALDAFQEGLQAGRLSLAASLCPYTPAGAEYSEWHRGRMITLAQAIERDARRAA